MKRTWLLLLAPALWCTSAAQAKTLRDYRVPDVEGYSRVSFLAGGDTMLATSGMEGETSFSRRAADGSVRYEITVPMMGTQRGTMSASLPDGRYAAAFRADEVTDEVHLYDETGEADVFALPTGADYIRLEQEYIALLYCDAREVKLIDYAGQEALTLALPGERVPLYIEVLTGREGIYLLARTQATDGENAMDAPYLLCRYNRSGALQWEMLLLESELGFYLYGNKCADAQDGLVIVGADKTDYKKAHILRIDAAGERTFHHVVSEKQGAVVSFERAVPDGEDTLLVGTAMAQSRGVFTCVTLRVDSAGGVTGQEIREFTQTSNYLYGVTAAPDGTAYAVKSEQKDKSTEYAWLSVVPLTDLSATDRAQLAIE